jgi:hypothetical protein
MQSWLVPCSAYYSTLTMEAVHPSETSVDFLPDYQCVTSQKIVLFKLNLHVVLGDLLLS